MRPHAGSSTSEAANRGTPDIAKPRVYTPWPEDVMYIPGEGDAPELKAPVKFGEVPQVGDLPRIGKRPGDPRCQDRSGFMPCQGCLYEQASARHWHGNIMPGLENAEAAGKNPYTGMPFPMPHPFEGPTPEMNTGRGCDIYGKPYKRPARFLYLNIHRFNEEVTDYEVSKSYELDFGPAVDSAEYKEGLAAWKLSEDFLAYEKEQRKSDPDWKWQDPDEEKPWEKCELVTPTPWLTDDYVVEDPLEQHMGKIQEWARKPHQPWPSWGSTAEDDSGEPPVAIEDRTPSSHN